MVQVVQQVPSVQEDQPVQVLLKLLAVLVHLELPARCKQWRTQSTQRDAASASLRFSPRPIVVVTLIIVRDLVRKMNTHASCDVPTKQRS